ncbi:MAG: ATP-binding cassette domain-containing protein, partial [Eggerthellaceae bacterium]
MASVKAIEARGFSFRYPESTAGIGPLDWRGEEGAFQLIVGATGSGKTTLLRCCTPAVAPAGERAGSLSLFGRPVDGLDVREAAATAGYVAQSPENQIVCDSVWRELAFGLENLGVPQDAMRRRVAEVAHFFGIEPWFRRSVAELSGGQKQMTTLAGTLAMQPRLPLLDEPTAQLDPVAEKNFLHTLFRVNRELGITVVVATHAPEAMAEYATDMVELREGTLIRCFEPRAGVSALRRSESVPVAPASAQDDEAAYAVSLHDIHLRYARDADWVLRGCDLRVTAGSIHAVVGGNGTGKSTLLRAIAGVVKPERGRVENCLAARQALLPQDPKTLFVCDTVAEELREWQANCGYDNAAIDGVLARFGLDARLQPSYDLSGGQQQLLAFAKLLLAIPTCCCSTSRRRARRAVEAAGRPHPARSRAGRGDRRPRHARPDVRRARRRCRHHAVRRGGRVHRAGRRVLRGQPVLPPDRGCVLPAVARGTLVTRPPSRAAARLLALLEVPALAAVPLVLGVCAYFQVEQGALLTVVVAFAAVGVFFASFEASRPALRQIMPTVVLAALAAAGRMLFAPVPDFKPVSAICILAGAVFGRRSGFLVGALAALVSNFFFGQGPWTPWQMYAWG